MMNAISGPVDGSCDGDAGDLKWARLPALAKSWRLALSGLLAFIVSLAPIMRDIPVYRRMTSRV